jgi:hypothetical protein
MNCRKELISQIKNKLRVWILETRENIKSKLGVCIYQREQNIADIITKQSTGPRFVQHGDYALGIIDNISLDPVVIIAFALIARRILFRVYAATQWLRH